MWLLCLAVVVVVLVTSGWYASRPVRPRCVVGVSVLTDGNGKPLSGLDAKQWTIEERAEMAYWYAVGAGRCKPPEPRWRQWLS